MTLIFQFTEQLSSRVEGKMFFSLYTLPAKCGQTLSDAEAKSFAVLHYKMKENKTKQN